MASAVVSAAADIRLQSAGAHAEDVELPSFIQMEHRGLSLKQPNARE
jgi:hypothetical protein